MNKRYTVARVRERLSDALDEAESGVDIVIERRGTRFRLAVVEETPLRKSRHECASHAIARICIKQADSAPRAGNRFPAIPRRTAVSSDKTTTMRQKPHLAVSQSECTAKS